MMFFAVMTYKSPEQGTFEVAVHGNTHKEILDKIDSYTKLDRISVAVYKTTKVFEVEE